MSCKAARGGARGPSRIWHIPQTSQQWPEDWIHLCKSVRNYETRPASDSDCTTEYEPDTESDGKSYMSVSDYIDSDDEFQSVDTAPEVQDLAKELGYSIFV